MFDANTVNWINYAVDWITLTYADPKFRDWVALKADRWLHEKLKDGWRCQLWEQYGYQGWDISGLRYGTRQMDDYVALKSETARLNWLDYYHEASNCSRLDLSATVQFCDANPGIIAEHFETIQSGPENLHKSRSYAIIQSLLGGDTLYVGKRSSAHYGRIYDKAIESADPMYENCIRYEVEVKKPYSSAVAEALASSENHSGYISAYVSEWFRHRGVSVPWAPEITYNAIEIPRRATDDEKALEWLERGVGPTVKRLISAGLREETFLALGLYDIPIEE